MESPKNENDKNRNKDVLTAAVTALGIGRESVLKYRSDEYTGEMVIITKEGAKLRYSEAEEVRGKTNATGKIELTGGKDIP